MATSGTGSGNRPRVVTADRAGRLCRLVALLKEKPQTRALLLRRLRLDIRGFYRDLQLLRDLEIAVEFTDGRYVLTDGYEEAMAKMPLPDPALNLHEAMQLAQGNTPAHRKLRALIEELTGTPLPSPRPSRRK